MEATHTFKTHFLGCKEKGYLFVRDLNSQKTKGERMNRGPGAGLAHQTPAPLVNSLRDSKLSEDDSQLFVSLLYLQYKSLKGQGSFIS